MALRTTTIRINENHLLSNYFDDITLYAAILKKKTYEMFVLTWTGIKKEVSDRSEEEIEMLDKVNKGIELANQKAKLRWRKLKNPEKGPTEYRPPTKEYPFLSSWTIGAIMRNLQDEDFYMIPPNVSMTMVDKACKDMKAYFAALKEWERNRDNNDHHGKKPKMPGSSMGEKTTATFSCTAARIMYSDDEVWLKFPRTKFKLKLGCSEMFLGKYIHTEVSPSGNGYRVLVSMDDGKEEVKPPENPKRIWGLDLGVTNFVSCANNYGAVPFIVKGGWIKSMNRLYNKKFARLSSDYNRGRESCDVKGDSRRMYAVSRKREDRLRDCYYKVVHFLCKRASEEKVEVVVIGKFDKAECIKKGKKLKKTNQNMAYIPYTNFLKILISVAEKYGIVVIVREESYTSKASAIDKDPIPTYVKGNKTKYEFSGKRTHRGLYRTNENHVLNADVNGAANIARKEFPEAFKGVDLSFLTKSVEVVGFRDLYPIKGKKKEPYKKKKKTCPSAERHRERKRKREELTVSFAKCNREYEEMKGIKR